MALISTPLGFQSFTLKLIHLFIKVVKRVNFAITGEHLR